MLSVAGSLIVDCLLFVNGSLSLSVSLSCWPDYRLVKLPPVICSPSSICMPPKSFSSSISFHPSFVYSYCAAIIFAGPTNTQEFRIYPSPIFFVAKISVCLPGSASHSNGPQGKKSHHQAFSTHRFPHKRTVCRSFSCQLNGLANTQTSSSQDR